MTIRPATLDDVPALVALGRAQLADSYGDAVADNPAQLAAVAEALVAGSQSAVWVADGAAGVVGMIGLVCAPHFLSGVPTAAEVMWYVDPGARGVGLRLLRAAERWAVAHGAAVMQLIAPTAGDGARVGQLYDRLGYRAVETQYQRRLAKENGYGY